MLNILRSLWIVSSLILFLMNFTIPEISAYECGRTEYIQPQTLNGEVSDRGAWPFLAALFLVKNSEFICGSTLISSKHVLTAAHCVYPKSSTERDPEDVIVSLGAYNIDIRIERGARQMDVDDIRVHPDWEPWSEKYDADLAILVLSQIVEFTKYIRPVCMPENDPPVDMNGLIVGWGLSDRTTAYNRHESVPLQANIRILNDSYCYTTHHFLAFRSTPRLFCGGDGGSPSKGDSGGGLFVLSGSSWIQYGIISIMSSDSNGKTLSDVFSLYTNLKEFKNWIDKVVEESGGNVMTKAKEQTFKIDLLCYARGYVSGPPLDYNKCHVYDSNVTNDNFEVRYISYVGHINEILFVNGTLEYIPYGIGKTFTGLQGLTVGKFGNNLGLKRLQRLNFENMENLTNLTLQGNMIETIDEDTLRDLPNLQTFNIFSNKVKRLGKHIFEKNTKLLNFYAVNNQIEYLHRDLFKNNPLLKIVGLMFNRLKLIYVDFTRLRSILLVDLHFNVCINKCNYDFDGSVAGLQSDINQKCRGL